MNRKYPAKSFWQMVAMNFLLRYFYLAVPGVILCLVGIRAKACLRVGLALLCLDLALSIAGQMRIRKTIVSPSDNPDFNALMDAFTGPGGLRAVKNFADQRIDAAKRAEYQEEEPEENEEET